jgi:3-hydroxybutyryl-CoA dehydratase
MTDSPDTDLTRLVGEQITFSKTVSESDVYGFAGITGDFGRTYIDQAYMATGPYGRRIAHGALILGYASTARTRLFMQFGLHGVSTGYDRVRFLKPLLFDDTMTVTYTLERAEPDKQRAYTNIEVHNQHDELCVVATELLKFFAVIPTPGRGPTRPA